MNTTFQVLEFDKILNALQELASTSQAKEQIMELRPYLAQRELSRSLRETTQAKQMLELIGMPPLPLMEHMEECLDKAVKGDMLLAEELEQTAAFLTAVKRMDEYLERGKIHQISIAYYNESLVPLEELRAQITRSIRGGQIDDHATSELRDIRRELQKLEARIQEKAENIMRTQKSCMSDSFIVKRNGQICVPVKKECKSKVPGTVMDQSSTGATVFIRPQTVAKLGEEWEMKKIEEDCEERRILYTLSSEVAEQEGIFRENLKTIIRLDFMFAKGKLSMDMKGICPEINTEGYIRLKGARHPLLDQMDCVPLDIKLGGDDKTQGMVITGPNTGGKTVAIKTVGLFSLMACSGLHVPCAEAEISMQNQVLCDIGDGQNISDNLSTFSAHIRNVITILEQVTEESLVILDELGSGTDPAEGMGIAIAILEKLRTSRCLFLVTTHYPEVKTYALKHPEIVSARMAFDRERLQPLYRLEMGKTGDSCALYIAKRLGMPEDMIALASREAYGEEGNHWNHTPAAEKRRKGARPARPVPRIQRAEQSASLKEPVCTLKRGDSVTVLPEGVIGIVVEPADRRGDVLVQIKKEKVRMSHKRLKLKVAAEELYPEDYDFSIIFDTVENRKARHQMNRKYQEGLVIESE